MQTAVTCETISHLYSVFHSLALGYDRTPRVYVISDHAAKSYAKHSIALRLIKVRHQRNALKQHQQLGLTAMHPANKIIVTSFRLISIVLKFLPHAL